MAGWQNSLNRCHVSYLQNVPGLLVTLDRKAPVFDFPILLQKMVARYRQSCMAILMDYASQCDRVFCGDSKRKINVKYFLIPAYNKYLSQVCRSAGLQVCKSASLRVCGSAGLQVCKSAGLQVCRSASLQVCSLRLSHTAILHPVRVLYLKTPVSSP